MRTKLLVRNWTHKIVCVSIVVALLITWNAMSTSVLAQSTSTKALAVLKHVPVGNAYLSWNAKSDTLTVSISVIGLAPKSTHPAHIHAGSCEKAGGILFPLHNVIADATGAGSSQTTLTVKGGIPATGWYINIHNGPGLNTPDQFEPISCGNIRNPGHAHMIHVHLGSSPNPDQDANGFTLLRIVRGDLVVTIAAQGLRPNSAHAAHIHAGNCRNTGKVLYNLTPLIADATGSASKTVVFKGVSKIPGSGWDVNVHRTTDLSTQTGYDPILCGNVEAA